MTRWTSLVPWEFESPIPGSLTSTHTLGQGCEGSGFHYFSQLRVSGVLTCTGTIRRCPRTPRDRAPGKVSPAGSHTWKTLQVSSSGRICDRSLGSIPDYVSRIQTFETRTPWDRAPGNVCPADSRAWIGIASFELRQDLIVAVTVI